jgi:hypothetical protein
MLSLLLRANFLFVIKIPWYFFSLSLLPLHIKTSHAKRKFITTITITKDWRCAPPLPSSSSYYSSPLILSAYASFFFYLVIGGNPIDPRGSG